MINLIMSVIIWSICVGIVGMMTIVGVVLIWATKFDQHIRQQTKKRQDDE